MATLEIPLDISQPDHQFYLDLEKVVYLFHFRLNARSNRWMMSIYAEDGTTLLLGSIPLVVDWDLTGRFKNEELPPGKFAVLDLTGNAEEPTEDSFGTTHILVYVESTGG